MKKRIFIISMFPDYFKSLTEFGVLGSALRKERESEIEFELITLSLREFSPKDFKGVDDAPFGGGVGMVMRADVLQNALLSGIVEKYQYKNIKEDLHIVCPSPRGTVWNHDACVDFAQRNFSLSSQKDLVFICGRYEGIDERFLELYVDEFISLGDYILTGGEIAVMAILDSSMRFVEGVLGNKLSAVDESFASGLLEYPLYTRPREFEGMTVPEAYLLGHHKKIEEHKLETRLQMTKKYRPDLYQAYKEKNLGKKK